MVNSRILQVRPDYAQFPLQLRAGTSDEAVVLQIFRNVEYRTLCSLSNVELIIDCGANIGCSSAFFLSQFSNCHVMAIEPDPENYSLLQTNMRPYGNRVQTWQAGVWSDDVPLVVCKGGYRDGQPWATQVRSAFHGEQGDVQGITISKLLSESPFARISILKVDIEGAEAILFANRPAWLDRVDAIAIELHDDSQFGNATRIFYDAIQHHPFEISRDGELTICIRKNPIH